VRPLRVVGCEEVDDLRGRTAAEAGLVLPQGRGTSCLLLPSAAYAS